jgi:hypothetical protein
MLIPLKCKQIYVMHHKLFSLRDIEHTKMASKMCYINRTGCIQRHTWLLNLAINVTDPVKDGMQ